MRITEPRSAGATVHNPFNKLPKAVFDVMFCKVFCYEAVPNKVEAVIAKSKREGRKMPYSKAFKMVMIETIDKAIMEGVYDEFPVQQVMQFREDVVTVEKVHYNGEYFNTNVCPWTKKSRRLAGRGPKAKNATFYFEIPKEKAAAIRAAAAIFDKGSIKRFVEFIILKWLDENKEIIKTQLQHEKEEIKEQKEKKDAKKKEIEDKNSRLLNRHPRSVS